MTVYAESSAILSWLLGERDATRVRDCLGTAAIVIASDLTLVECDRVLIRAVAMGELPEAEAAGRRAELNAAAAHWVVLRLSAEVIDRARQRLPREPVRTLDALHLACALVARGATPDVDVLSLDEHIRTNAAALGFDLQPTEEV